MGLWGRRRAKLIEEAQSVLIDGEQVLDLTTGRSNDEVMTYNSVMLVTDRRVIVFSKRFLGHDVHYYPYGELRR